MYYSDKYFVNSSPEFHILFENRMRKVLEILEHLLYLSLLLLSVSL